MSSAPNLGLCGSIVKAEGKPSQQQHKPPHCSTKTETWCTMPKIKSWQESSYPKPHSQEGREEVVWSWLWLGLRQYQNPSGIISRVWLSWHWTLQAFASLFLMSEGLQDYEVSSHRHCVCWWWLSAPSWTQTRLQPYGCQHRKHFLRTARQETNASRCTSILG